MSVQPHTKSPKPAIQTKQLNKVTNALLKMSSQLTRTAASKPTTEKR